MTFIHSTAIADRARKLREDYLRLLELKNTLEQTGQWESMREVWRSECDALDMAKAELKADMERESGEERNNHEEQEFAKESSRMLFFSKGFTPQEPSDRAKKAKLDNSNDAEVSTDRCRGEKMAASFAADVRFSPQRAKPDVSRRLLQFAERDALAISKPTEPSLKRLPSVVSASTQGSPEPDPAGKIRSVERVVNPMATVLKAVTEAAEDANNPKSLQHRLVDDPRRVKGTNYQNQKTAGFSGNADTGKTVEEQQMKVPDVGLQKYMDGGRLVSSEAITESSTEKILCDTIGSGNTKPAANGKEDSVIKKSVPGTLSTTRPLEDASSRTIFVANVHFGATKDGLSRHFNKFGEVLKAVIVADPATGQPSGSAYIEFTRKEAAESALSLDGTSFMSRILKIVKGSNGQQQEAASSMSWSRAGGRLPRASPYRRGIPGGAFRGLSVVRAGARSMQWKRDSAETGNNNIVAPSPRSMTYVRTESQSNGNAAV